MISRICSLIKMKQPVPTDAGLLIASGTTVPTDATLGYQTGCIFQKTNGAEGTSFYINEGSYTSCDFNAVASLTAAQEALLGAVAGTVTASKAVIVDASKDASTFGNVGAATVTAPVLVMTGTTGNQEIRLTTNLADALSIEDTAGDLIVFATTTGSQLITITPATTITGALTAATINSTNVDAGTSGTAGTVDVFPTTASKGKLILSCTDNTTNHTFTITNGAANGANVTVTLPALTGYVGISTAALTLAEMDVLDGATAGTATASKALVLDSNVKIDRLWINLGSNHGVYVTTATTGLTKNAFRAGDWGTELDIAAGYGAFRMYGKYSSGSGASTLGFVRALTESATIDVSGFQFYADCDAATPGPANVHAADFFAVVNTTKYLAAGANLYDGLIATWHKITAPVGAVINGNAFAIFLDNQVNVTVAGVEAAILSMTGGSRPDAWAYFKTTSSGYDQLFTFDSTFNSGAGTCVTTDAVPGTQDARIKVSYNGAQYYIPLYR